MIKQTWRKTLAWLSAATCLIAYSAVELAAQEQTGAEVPLINLTAAPGFGADVSIRSMKEKTPSEVATRLTFKNPLSERRIAAIAGTPAGTIEGARALAFDYRLAMQEGNAPPLVALFLEDDGGAWYRISKRGGARNEFGTLRLPLKGSFSRAVFADDTDETIQWGQVQRVWLGLLVDGPAGGVLEVRRVRFTNEPFRPDGPASLGKRWDVAQDSAIQSKLNPTAKGPEGATSVEYRFDLPGGRHMFAMTRTPVDVEEPDGYSGLKFTYQAELPKGIDGLLVMLIERDGTQYRAVPAPQASKERLTITIPFDKFERGSWSKDENDRLDLDELSYVAIGMHGTTPTDASGMIKVADVQFVP